MSEQTHANLEAAIAEHIADECGDSPILGGWVLAIEHMGVNEADEEASRLYIELPRFQSAFLTVGLVEAAREQYRCGRDE